MTTQTAVVDPGRKMPVGKFVFAEFAQSTGNRGRNEQQSCSMRAAPFEVAFRSRPRAVVTSQPIESYKVER
jgi:hypothetical protein